MPPLWNLKGAKPSRGGQDDLWSAACFWTCMNIIKCEATEGVFKGGCATEARISDTPTHNVKEKKKKKILRSDPCMFICESTSLPSALKVALSLFLNCTFATFTSLWWCVQGQQTRSSTKTHSLQQDRIQRSMKISVCQGKNMFKFQIVWLFLCKKFICCKFSSSNVIFEKIQKAQFHVRWIKKWKERNKKIKKNYKKQEKVVETFLSFVTSFRVPPSPPHAWQQQTKRSGFSGLCRGGQPLIWAR